MSSSSSSNMSADEELLRREMLSRVHSFFGDDGARKIQDAFVIVVGLGGVGSHAANMVARSGVGKIRIIDFDQVTLSSLNRHSVATLDDVGRSKASVLKNYLNKVIPWCQVDAIQEMFRGCDAERLLAGNPTFVLDCIDDISTKAELIAYCSEHKLTLLASLGAGGKADPTRLRIAPLSDCINDPLASKIKWKIKKHGISPESVMSVFSIEKPLCNLLPLDEDQKAAPQDFGAVDYLRLRVMPVLGTSPAIFGQAMASYILCQIAGTEFVPESCERLSKNLKHKLREGLKRNEHLRWASSASASSSSTASVTSSSSPSTKQGAVGSKAVTAGSSSSAHSETDAQSQTQVQAPTETELDIDDDDVEFIVQIMWGGRCALTQKRFGGHAPLVLTRWNANLPVVPHNLVLLIQTQATLLLDSKNIGADGVPTCFSPEVTRFITRKLGWGRGLLADDEGAGKMRGLVPADSTSLNGTSGNKRSQQETAGSTLESTFGAYSLLGGAAACLALGAALGYMVGSRRG